jgi:hypothetical protein
MGVKLVASSGGSVELVPTNTASNFTVTVPAVTATMLTNKTAGTVLQVVNATYAAQTSTTSTSYTDTGLTVSITPTSATSKILAIANMNGLGVVNSGTVVRLRLNRGATALAEFEREAAYSGSVTTELAVGGSGISYLDSPSTTSSTAYKVQFSSNNGNIVYVSLSTTVCTITLLEIAA